MKESIDDCEENSREESSPILKFKETRSAHRATMKGQHDKVQVVRMYKSDRSRTTDEESTISQNSTRSRTEEESTVSNSSNMSSTYEESTVSENNTQGNTTTPNKLDIHPSTFHSTARDTDRSIRFKVLRDNSFQGSQNRKCTQVLENYRKSTRT